MWLSENTAEVWATASGDVTLGTLGLKKKKESLMLLALMTLALGSVTLKNIQSHRLSLHF